MNPQHPSRRSLRDADLAFNWLLHVRRSVVTDAGHPHPAAFLDRPFEEVWLDSQGAAERSKPRFTIDTALYVIQRAVNQDGTWRDPTTWLPADAPPHVHNGGCCVEPPATWEPPF